MIYKFKLYGQRYMVDTASCAVHKLSQLQYDMLGYLTLPFEDSFPSALRYDLAKYESSQLAQAYMEFRKWHFDGVFMSDLPLKLHETEISSAQGSASVTYSERKFVFASDVIKLADSTNAPVSAQQDELSPVKECDYDILESEFERIAKEIIKRKTGRAEGEVFEFIPFNVQITADEKGYLHITDKGAQSIFEKEGFSIPKKCAECGIAIALEEI